MIDDDGATIPTDPSRHLVAKQPTTEVTMDTCLQTFIRATNACDVEAALDLFAARSVIEDASIGEAFMGRDRIRTYLETYFIGYHTVTVLLSSQPIGERRIRAHVDFTGDFGHETGVLDIRVDAAGLIERIDAALD